MLAGLSGFSEEKASPISENRARQIVSAEELNNLALVFLSDNQPDSALHYLDIALKNAGNSSDLFYSIRCIQNVAEYYYFKRDYDKAYALIKSVQNINDSLVTQVNNFEQRYNDAVYLSNERQGRLEDLALENETYEATLKNSNLALEKQRMVSFFITLILVLFTIMLVLVYYFYRRHYQTLKNLELSNKQIAQQKEEIEVQQQHLMDTNAELEKLSIIARETDNGVRVMNESGEVIWINDGYSRMFGYNLYELQMKNGNPFGGKKADADFKSLIDNWMGNKKPITYQSLNNKKSGEDIWVQTTLTPILNGEGNVDRMIAIDSDITRLKKAEEEIQLKNDDITASIAYAKRIQEAMLTPFSVLKNRFENSFCYYQPRDIVSGDFYWVTETNEHTIIVCADGTGHGVPGAFISVLGISFLNKVVTEKGFIKPATILNRLRLNIITHLNQNTEHRKTDDGMDMSVISIDKHSGHLEYAGAMNPLLVYRKGNFIELQPDRMPVGFFEFEERPFSTTNLTLEPEDQIFLYTDGYQDQFGGKSDAKMKSRRFREILAKTIGKGPEEQHKIIDDEFHKWKGKNRQVDDVLIMGIRV